MRLSKRERIFLYELLALRQGRKCAICATSESEHELVIDHIDGNPNNWLLTNLRLLCRKCNLLNQPSTGIAESVCESEHMVVRAEHGLMLRDASAEIRLNRVSEPEFRRWLNLRLLKEGRVLLSDAISGGAEHCQISTMTARRYLQKMLSSEGSLTVLEKVWIVVKPEHWAKLALPEEKA